MRSTQALRYMKEAWHDLPILAKELWEGSYEPSTCFLVKYPKLREVFAANFRDRIVHHWICLRVVPLFERRFVNQGDVSFNCRKGFGTDACIKRCAAGIERVSNGYTKSAWIFRGDLVGFFMSIDKKRLWTLLLKFLQRQRNPQEPEWMYWDILLRTTYVTIMHHPEKDCVLNSPPDDWKQLPKNKSFFGIDSAKGEPIGNLTTQQFANFYLSHLDQYVLFLFRNKNYSYQRFVDDFVITCDDLEFLKQSITKIGQFLKNYLGLSLHQNKRYLQPVSHGIFFVGSYIKPHRIYLSNRTLARFSERANGFKRLMEERELDVLDCKRIEQVINSYLGFCKDKRTYKKRKQIIQSMGNQFHRYFEIHGQYDSIRTKDKYRPLNLKEQ